MACRRQQILRITKMTFFQGSRSNIYTTTRTFLMEDISPVEIQNDLELDFKVFFFVDSCC